MVSCKVLGLKVSVLTFVRVSARSEVFHDRQQNISEDLAREQEMCSKVLL